MSELLHEGWMILAALLPSIGLLFLFFVIIKHMIEGDRRERAALRQLDREQGEKGPENNDSDASGTPASSQE